MCLPIILVSGEGRGEYIAMLACFWCVEDAAYVRQRICVQSREWNLGPERDLLLECVVSQTRFFLFNFVMIESGTMVYFLKQKHF